MVNNPLIRPYLLGTSQKESSFPTIHFQVRTVGFRGGTYFWLHSVSMMFPEKSLNLFCSPCFGFNEFQTG